MPKKTSVICYHINIIYVYCRFRYNTDLCEILAIVCFRPLLRRLTPANGACLLPQFHASFPEVLCSDVLILNTAHLVSYVTSLTIIGRGLALVVLPTFVF